MKLRVDYQEIREAICYNVAANLGIKLAAVRFVSITKGKGDNVRAEVEIDLDINRQGEGDQ